MFKNRKMSSASLWGFFLVSGLLICSSWAEPDPEICIPGPGSKDGPELPELPNQYRLFVEANIMNKNYSTEIEESYDAPGNRGSSYSITDTRHIFSTYDYKTGQSINVDVLTSKKIMKLYFHLRRDLEDQYALPLEQHITYYSS